MTGRRCQRMRSDECRSSLAASCVVEFTTNSADPAISVAIVPVPALLLHFGGKSHASFTPLWPAGAPQPAAAEPAPAAAAAEALELQTPPATASSAAAPPSSHIELIIDSLPHHTLTEPIPVTVDPLGDRIFTASVRNLGIHATGNGIGEALLLLKEQIEFVYDGLTRRLSQLSHDEKQTLQLLHTYVAPSSRTGWR